MRDHWWWRPGWRPGRRAYTFHVTFDAATVEGGSHLRRLAADYQARLAATAGLDCVPLEWLHLTMQNVGFTDEVGDSDIRAVYAEATVRCAELAPFELTFGPAQVRNEAIALRPSPVGPVFALRDRLRLAIVAVLGSESVPNAPEHAQGFQPHVSVAYGNEDAPDDRLVNVVTTESPNPAVVRVLAASLIVLDRDERVYRWSTYGAIPLTGGKEPTGLARA